MSSPQPFASSNPGSPTHLAQNLLALCSLPENGNTRCLPHSQLQQPDYRTDRAEEKSYLGLGCGKLEDEGREAEEPPASPGGRETEDLGDTRTLGVGGLRFSVVVLAGLSMPGYSLGLSISFCFLSMPINNNSELTSEIPWQWEWG